MKGISGTYWNLVNKKVPCIKVLKEKVTILNNCYTFSNDIRLNQERDNKQLTKHLGGSWIWIMKRLVFQ